MSSKPVNDSLLVRSLVLLAYRVRTHRYVEKLWKPSAGLPSLGKLCIKATPFEDLAEASALRFVAAHTSIPVPQVYSAFFRGNTTYIVMRKIDGQSLQRSWLQRSVESREKILAQLKRMLTELRAIPHPEQIGKRIANVDGGPIRDVRLPGTMHWGPFNSTREFHEALVDGNSLDAEYRELSDDLAQLFEFYRNAPEETVFTHGDLSSLNVLVKGDEVVGIVDWETAGWLPPYWEYSCAWNVNPYNTFWKDEVDNFLTPMSYELRMDNVRRKAFGSI